MDVNTEMLANQLADLGLERGDQLLVHSSLSSIGWVEGGADAVIDALLQSVGQEGTVLFPTLTGAVTDSPETPPHFDARNSPCWTGKIPETARLRPDAVRSLHPTHSVVAFGRYASWFTSDHELVRTPCGYGSPYDKLASVGGKILLIGVTQQCNTSYHHAEEVSGAPIVLQDKTMEITMTDMHGRQLTMAHTALHKWHYSRDYDAFEPEMLRQGICRIGRLGEASVRIVDAADLRRLLVRALLADPLATLDTAERERWLNEHA